MSYSPLHLLVIESCNNRQAIELKNKIYSIGRHSSNNIVIDFEKISRKHATLIHKKDPKKNQDIYWILDGDLQGKKSRNGILINAKKCFVKELKDGDIINFGGNLNAVYHFIYDSSNLSQLKAINERTTLMLSNNHDKGQEKLENKNNKQQNLTEKNSKNFDLCVKSDKLPQVKISLQRALEQEELLLYYQPLYNIQTGKIDCLEALLRWKHPKKGLILPSQIISLAEQTDLIIPIGQWVLKTACKQTQIWTELGLPSLSISVNLSSGQFCDPSLKKIISQVLNETGVIPKLLQLEITEKTIRKNENLATQIFDDLQNLGVHLSMDDFGTDYSSLSYLQQFPFDTLKIAQSFMKNFTNKPQDLALLSAVMAWGRITKLNIVAEGVETEEQLELLRRLNVQKIQDYHISVPLTAQEATQFLRLHFYEKYI